MQIKFEKNNKRLTVYPLGALTSSASIQFEQDVNNRLDGIDELFFNLESLSFICDEGLKALIDLNKKMRRMNGIMKIQNVKARVGTRLRTTGLINYFDIIK